MNKSTRTKPATPSAAKAWLQQARAELAGTGTEQIRQSGPKSRGRDSAVMLIFGLIALISIALLLVLTVTWPVDSPPPNDMMAALDISSAVEQQSLLAEPPPPPPTPVSQTQDVFKHYLARVDRDAPVPIAESSSPVQSTDLTLRGMEITQGIQVFQEPENPRCISNPDHPDSVFCNNSMPMVAHRHTMVRAYLACNGNCPTAETIIRLRVLKDGQEQANLTRQLSVDTLHRVNHLPIQDLRLNLDNSVNFELIPAPDWLSGQITFELETSSQAEVAQAGLSLMKEFAVREPLRIAYLPIEYQGLRPPDPADIDYWLKRLYPVPDVEYYRLPMPDVAWDGDVNKGEVLRKLLYTYWLYAQYSPAEAAPDQLFGWLPQELYNGGASDPFWCPNCAGPHSSRVAFGGMRPEQDIGGPRILVHEIAHNLGAQHAWSPTNKEDTGCFKAEGVDIQVDPDWPYAQTPNIQEVGIDLYSTPPVVYPPQIYDMMAYCTQPWISPHTYRKIFDSPFLLPDTDTPFSFSNFEAQAELTESGTLLVSGVVYPDGTVSKPEIIKLNGDAFGSAAGFTPPLEFTPPPGDDYCLDIQASDDSLLAQHCFDVGFTDLETGQATEASPYFFTLPAVNTEDVSKVSITKNRVSIIIVTPSNSEPEVTVTFPNGGEVLSGQQTITWNAYDADGDSLLFDVLYSPDGGQSWLPLAVRHPETRYTFYTSQVLPSDNALIRVIASDGFNTGIDESDGTFAIKPPPENSISLVGPPTVKPGQTFEVDVVANRVTEPGLFGVQFEVIFNPDLVQVETISANSALDLVVDDTIQNDAGLVSFIASRKGRVENLTGQITLATLTLTAAQNEGQVFLDLRNVDAGARGGIRMPISETQGLSLHIGN